MNERSLTVRIADGISALDPRQWDALDISGNPFMRHGFLSALEDSGSVGPGTGWTALPLLIEDDAGDLLAAMPTYAKGHSQGEYVFDHAWADAYERAGGDYYPKLQIAAPFTPATGPRILTQSPDLAVPLLRAAEQLCVQNGFSSAHATFLDEGQAAIFEKAGWLLRHDTQFHWTNRDYRTFEDFLAGLASRKRKAVRKERAEAQDGVTIRHLRGSDIEPEHWDAFWIFYQDTGARKWGTPYLTREAFDLMAERMGDSVLMILASIDDTPIAGALNFIGQDALYGRYWGCTLDKRFLHFELCYYQAIDVAIALGLKRVEAGAQGGHKLARGYDPVRTVSAHYIRDPGFRAVVADYLDRERRGVATEQMILRKRAPFRKTSG